MPDQWLRYFNTHCYTGCLRWYGNRDMVIYRSVWQEYYLQQNNYCKPCTDGSFHFRATEHNSIMWWHSCSFMPALYKQCDRWLSDQWLYHFHPDSSSWCMRRYGYRDLDICRCLSAYDYLVKNNNSASCTSGFVCESSGKYPY